jgi:hypothetical protein
VRQFSSVLGQENVHGEAVVEEGSVLGQESGGPAMLEAGYKLKRCRCWDSQLRRRLWLASCSTLRGAGDLRPYGLFWKSSSTCIKGPGAPVDAEAIVWTFFLSTHVCGGHSLSQDKMAACQET